MLDTLDRLLTPCPWHVRAMGYVREAVGIRRRYRRCRADWQEHIDRCREIILRGAARCKQRRKAVILGGGLLHDVPLAELCESFREVILVDIVHPLRSQLRTWRYRNLRRVRADVTGTVADVYRVSDEPEKPLPMASVPDLFLNDAELDLTVSLNLLSQLPCMPLDYLAIYRAHSQKEMEEYARGVIRVHLDYLARLPGRVVLVTDIERMKIDMMRRVVERKDLLFGLELPKAGDEWEWRLAPCPEADPRHHYFRRVVGIADFK